MKTKLKKSVPMKSAVCAVTATALLCLSQPVWGDASTVSVTATASTGSLVEYTEENVSTEIPNGAKISSKQAEETIKRLFPLLKKASVTSAEFTEQNNVSTGVKIWDIQFSFQRGNGSYGFNASVNAITGEVVSIYLPRDILLLASSDTGSELSREAASKKALDWIKQNVKSVNAADLSENEMYIGLDQTLFSPASYDFYYSVTVNGIPSDADTIRMSLDHQGQVTSFNRFQMTSMPSSTVPKVSAETVRKQYEESFVAELSYISSSQLGIRKGPYFLGYVPKNSSNLNIDANTGSVLDTMGEALKADQFDPIVIPAGKEKFTPSPKPLVSGNDAVNWVESQITIPKGYKASQKRLGQRWNDKDAKVWNLSWRNSDITYGGFNINAEVDAKTGMIYSYNTFPYWDQGVKQDKPSTTSISKKDAEQIAFRTISKLAPNADKEWKLTSVTEPRKNTTIQSYEFTFNRYADDIKILDENFTILIGMEGQINLFNNYSSADLSELPLNSKPVISAEQAKEAFLKEMDLKLKFAQYGSYGVYGDSSPEFFTKLVYSPVRKNNNQPYEFIMPLDAITGKWRETIPAELTSKEVIPAKDAQGHKAQIALDKMVKYHVMTPDAEQKLWPDQEVTTGEWYVFVARALNPSFDQYFSESTEAYGNLHPDHKYYNAVQSLVSQGWLPFEPEASFNPERKLTRDELALILTQMLKYEKLAASFTKSGEVSGISDSASIVNKGAATITMKLGLLPGVDGKFLPERVVTRAEVAEVLLDLSTMVGKSDSFLNGNNRW